MGASAGCLSGWGEEKGRWREEKDARRGGKEEKWESRHIKRPSSQGQEEVIITMKSVLAVNIFNI